MTSNAQIIHDRARDLTRRIEHDLPASELATALVVLLADMRNFLQSDGKYPQWPDGTWNDLEAAPDEKQPARWHPSHRYRVDRVSQQVIR